MTLFTVVGNHAGNLSRGQALLQCEIPGWGGCSLVLAEHWKTQVLSVNNILQMEKLRLKARLWSLLQVSFQFIQLPH